MAETFSPNSSIDAAIKQMLDGFSETSQQRLKKAIRDAGAAARRQQTEQADAGARHIFREYIPAYELNRRGYQFEYEHPIDGKTPDWTDTTNQIILESYTFERGAKTPFVDRAKSNISKKCAKYETVVNKLSFKYVIAVYLDFCTGVDLDDLEYQGAEFLPEFSLNSHLTGLLFFTESHYVENWQYYKFLTLTTESNIPMFADWPFPLQSLNDGSDMAG